MKNKVFREEIKIINYVFLSFFLINFLFQIFTLETCTYVLELRRNRNLAGTGTGTGTEILTGTGTFFKKLFNKFI